MLDINITITTLDKELARLLEPRAPRPDLRLETVRKLRRSRASCVGVFPNPIMPLHHRFGRSAWTPWPRRRRRPARITSAAARCFCMPGAQKVFFPFLERDFPHLAARYRETVREEPATWAADYKERLREARAGAFASVTGWLPRLIEYRPELWEDDRAAGAFPAR